VNHIWLYFCLRVLWCLLAGAVLSLPPNQRSLSFICAVWMLALADPLFLALHHRAVSDVLEYLSFALYLFGCLWDDRWSRRFASKLKSMALTAVNAATFKRQQSEAFALRGSEG
jgi:hypothetical protein